MKTVSAIVHHQRGKPAEVVRVERVELPELALGEARVRVRFAPINPADLNAIEGTYAKLPPLPAVPGGEGVGIVEEVAADVRGVAPGDFVLLPAGAGSWREACNVAAEKLTAIPPDLDLQQAAMLRVNPATALRMLLDFVPLQPGDWIVQNAANSGVGRAVIQIAKARGWRTVNVVRRAELVDELSQLGADVVLVEGDALVDEIRAATDAAPIQLALNAVGGESALRLANALAPGGTHVTYGAMARQPLRIPNGLLIFNDISFRGFWVTRWYERASADERAVMLRELVPLVASGALRVPVDEVFPLARGVEAVARAMEGKRAGKVLLELSPS